MTRTARAPTAARHVKCSRRSVRLGFVSLLALFAVACGSAAPTPAAPSAPTTAAGGATATAIAGAPAVASPTAAKITPERTTAPEATSTANLLPTPTSTGLPAAANEFRPTDPALVSLVAGRPQFIEFFAFW